MYTYMCTHPHAMFLFTVGTIYQANSGSHALFILLLFMLSLFLAKAESIVYVMVDGLQSMSQVQPATCF